MQGIVGSQNQRPAGQAVDDQLPEDEGGLDGLPETDLIAEEKPGRELLVDPAQYLVLVRQGIHPGRGSAQVLAALQEGSVLDELEPQQICQIRRDSQGLPLAPRLRL